MKQNKILTLLLAACISFSAHAGAIKDDMLQRATKIKDPEVRVTLSKLIKNCIEQNWFECHIAKFDLVDKAAFNFDSDMGRGGPKFKEMRANDLYSELTDKIYSNIEFTRKFMIVIQTPVNSGLPKEIEALRAVDDAVWEEMSLDAIQYLVNAKNMQIDVRHGMSNTRPEWIRQLAWFYAIRNDKDNAMRALTELQKYAKNKPEDTLVYNNTLTMIKYYLK